MINRADSINRNSNLISTVGKTLPSVPLTSCPLRGSLRARLKQK